MAELVRFTIDNKECMAQKDSYIVEAAKENGIYIPTLCNVSGLKPRGACRLCTVKVNGKLMTACSTPVADGMVIEAFTEELENIRRTIIELMFAEGNHFCPSCEKSGMCELQALAYRYRIDVPRFPYRYPAREVEATHPKLVKDHNRCILCKRCIRGIKDEKGRSVFAFKKRGKDLIINIDTELAHNMSDEMAKNAAAICPVGAILVKEKGFSIPIGMRKYDKTVIGSDIEK